MCVSSRSDHKQNTGNDVVIVAVVVCGLACLFSFIDDGVYSHTRVCVRTYIHT